MESLVAPVSSIPRSYSIFNPRGKFPVARRRCSALPSPPSRSHRYQYHSSRFFPIFFSSKNSSSSGHHGHNQEDPSADPDSNTLIPLFRDKASFSHLSSDGLGSQRSRKRLDDGFMDGRPTGRPRRLAINQNLLPNRSPPSHGLFTRSPRRRMRVGFTCNVCGQHTTCAINPHAYTDGTVFVQCAGCNVFHKLVDNLNLFHEMKGSGESENQHWRFHR